MLRLLIGGVLVVSAVACGTRCDSSSHFDLDLDGGPVCLLTDAGPGGVCAGNVRVSCPAGCSCYSLRTLDACGVELYHGSAACFCGLNPATHSCDAPNCGSIHCGSVGCPTSDAGVCPLGV